MSAAAKVLVTKKYRVGKKVKLEEEEEEVEADWIVTIFKKEIMRSGSHRGRGCVSLLECVLGVCVRVCVRVCVCLST